MGRVACFEERLKGSVLSCPAQVQFDVSVGISLQGFLLQCQQNPLGVRVHPGAAGCSHQLPDGAVPAETGRCSPRGHRGLLDVGAAAAVALHGTATPRPSPGIAPGAAGAALQDRRGNGIYLSLHVWSCFVGLWVLFGGEMNFLSLKHDLK